LRRWAKRLVAAVFGEVIASSIKREITIQWRKRSGRFARGGMDIALERYMNQDHGFYVELGANDGARASNTYYFELKRGWQGVLVEPCPNLYLACRKRRGRRNAVYCNACVDFDHDRRYVDMRYAGPMTVSQSLDKDLGDEVAFNDRAAHLLPSGEAPFDFGAVAATLTALLDDANAPESIDLLSLDVEGAELPVLKGIDFDRYRFCYILVECRALPPLEEFLESQGYILVESLTHYDYLFAPAGSDDQAPPAGSY
jgi:FkbM family methyltransferase